MNMNVYGGVKQAQWKILAIEFQVLLTALLKSQCRSQLNVYM